MFNIAVFFGGKSVEHDISIITAMQAMRGLKNYNVIPVYILPDGRFVTGKKLKRSQSFLNFKLSGCRFLTFEMGKANLLILSKNKIKEKIKTAPFYAIMVTAAKMARFKVYWILPAFPTLPAALPLVRSAWIKFLQKSC